MGTVKAFGYPGFKFRFACLAVAAGFLSWQGGKHLLGELDVAVSGAAAAVFSFQHLQQGLHIGSRGMCFLVVEIGPGPSVITLGLEAPEAGLLDDSDLTFDSVFIANHPFMVTSHGAMKTSGDSSGVDMISE